MSRGHFLARIALLSLLLGACGPASCCRSAEVENYEIAYAEAIAREVDGFEFTRPPAEAWPEILAVLAERGFPIAESTPVESRTLESPFKEVSHGAQRILLRVTRIDAGRWKLSVQMQYRFDVNGRPQLSIDDRDREAVEIGWRIIQRVEAARASEISARVGKKAERAGATGRGYDRGCSACASLVPGPRS